MGAMYGYLCGMHPSIFRRQCRQALLDAGIAATEADALWTWLIAERLAMSRIQWELLDDLSADTMTGLQRDVDRMVNHEPLAHVLGYVDFDGLQLHVGPEALIPRPETVFLVDQVVDKLPQGGRVLDVGTGTGCIALAVKSRRYDSQVTGLDLSPEALQCAERNGLSLSLDVQWVQGDLSKDPPKGQWDMIVSNPPYIPMQERDNLDASVREFEPAMALHSPASDDIYFFRRLIQWAETLLSPGAWLLMEGHHVLAATVVNLLIEQGWSEVQLCKDDCGKPRMILAKRP